MADMQILLLQISGRDRSGIVAGVLETLGAADAEIQDIEQIVIRGRISLSLVVNVPPGEDLLKEVLLFGWENELQVDFEVVDSQDAERRPGWIVTVLGRVLSANDLHTISACIAESGTNIDKIVRLSNYPVWSYELLVSGGVDDELKANLLTLAMSNDTFDIAIQREGLGRRAQRLVVLDVDSTLIQNEAIDLLADVAGCGAEVSKVTEAAMRGEIDFESALRDRVALLGGQPEEIIDVAYERMELTPGARTFVRTLKRLGYKVAIVSGGFTAFTDRLKSELELDYAFANTLDRRRGVLTGDLTGRVVDRQGKADLLEVMAQAEGIDTAQVIAVGDGANDLAMLDAAGLGIAFNAKPIVQEAADTALSVPYLDAILYVLGVRREEVESEGLTPKERPRV